MQPSDVPSIRAFVAQIPAGVLTTAPTALSAGKAILAADKDVQILRLRQAVAWIAASMEHPVNAVGPLGTVKKLCIALLKRNLPLDLDDYENLLSEADLGASNFLATEYIPYETIFKALQSYIYLHGASETITTHLASIRGKLRSGRVPGHLRKATETIDQLIGAPETNSVTVAGKSLPLDSIRLDAASALLAEFLAEAADVGGGEPWGIWAKELSSFETGRTILESEVGDKVLVLRQAVTEHSRLDPAVSKERCNNLLFLVHQLIRCPLEYSSGDLAHLLDNLQLRPLEYSALLTDDSVWPIVDDYILRHGLSEDLAVALKSCRHRFARFNTMGEFPPLAHKMNELMRAIPVGLPEPGEDWAEAVAADLVEAPIAQAEQWRSVFSHSLDLGDAKPSKKWLAGAADRIADLESESVRSCTSRWADLMSTHDAALTDRNANIVRGLILHIAQLPPAVAIPVLRRFVDVCYEKVPDFGPRCTKAGNACFTALGMLGSQVAIDLLLEFQAALPYKSAQGVIEGKLRELGVDTGWKKPRPGGWRGVRDSLYESLLRDNAPSEPSAPETGSPD